MTRSWSARCSLSFSDALSCSGIPALFLWSYRSLSIEKRALQETVTSIPPSRAILTTVLLLHADGVTLSMVRSFGCEKEGSSDNVLPEMLAGNSSVRLSWTVALDVNMFNLSSFRVTVVLVAVINLERSNVYMAMEDSAICGENRVQSEAVRQNLSRIACRSLHNYSLA